MRWRDVVDSWRKEYVDDGTDNIKAKHTGAKRTDREAKLNDIKLVEAQLGQTRQALYAKIFSTGPAEPQKEDDSIIGGAFFEIFNTEVSGVGSEVSSWSSMLANQGKDNDSVLGLIKDEDGDPVFGEKVAFGSKTSSGVTDGMGMGATSADGLSQVYAFIKAGKDWKENKGKDTFLPALKMLEAGAKVAKDVASIGSTVEKINKPAEKPVAKSATDSVAKKLDGTSPAKDSSKLEGWAKGAKWTSGLADAISFVKNTAEGIISIYKAVKRKGVDDEMAITHGVQGGISVGKAAQSAIKATDAFLKIAGTAIPAPFMQAVPIIGIVINIASAALSIYQAYKASVREKEMAELSNKFAPKALGSPHLTLAQQIGGISVGDLKKITQSEERGVLNAFGFGKKYLRFNAFVLAKIDAHLSGDDKGKPLEIQLDGGTKITLSPSQVAKIREI